ncbi:MAG: FAD-dependent oxidoreductase [candidate division NC10 bacterium]|nr:FAD-dependent oxidoreductase [candidate division NC10 bacterium]
MGDVHRVVIVGGGFGGLQAARSLKKAPMAVTVVDRRNFHLMELVQFQNRVLVFLRWAWSYFPFNRSARLITDPCREMQERDKHATSRRVPTAAEPGLLRGGRIS